MKRTINEHELKDVLEYFVKGYKLKKGENLVSHETYIDTIKGKVFIITYIDKEE
ncbi:hypothetical protein M0R04_10385 [Candidatus Dojkabacteria bacterium]|jgi:hypothetical protein|nr:hypothetical protein [Candidatus Dojkabacteria bacterium]